MRSSRAAASVASGCRPEVAVASRCSRASCTPSTSAPWPAGRRVCHRRPAAPCSARWATAASDLLLGHEAPAEHERVGDGHVDQPPPVGGGRQRLAGALGARGRGSTWSTSSDSRVIQSVCTAVSMSSDGMASWPPRTPGAASPRPPPATRGRRRRGARVRGRPWAILTCPGPSVWGPGVASPRPRGGLGGRPHRWRDAHVRTDRQGGAGDRRRPERRSRHRPGARRPGGHGRGQRHPGRAGRRDRRRRSGTPAAPPPSVGFDVTDYDDVVAGVERVVAEARARSTSSSTTPATAAAEGMTPTKFRDSDPASWRGPIDVNLYGVMNCSRAVINPHGREGLGPDRHHRLGRRRRRASTSACRPTAAARAAPSGSCATSPSRTPGPGVTANTLAIGLMERTGNREVTEALARQIPVGRTGVPEDIAYAVRLPRLRRGRVGDRPDHARQRRLGHHLSPAAGSEAAEPGLGRLEPALELLDGRLRHLRAPPRAG